jgi:hypothetical protein
VTTAINPPGERRIPLLRRRNVQALIWFTIAVILLIPTLFPAVWIVLSSLKTSAETHTFPPRFIGSEISLDGLPRGVRAR